MQQFKYSFSLKMLTAGVNNGIALPLRCAEVDSEHGFHILKYRILHRLHADFQILSKLLIQLLINQINQHKSIIDWNVLLLLVELFAIN